MTHGNHPFGALLVDAAGEVLMEVENGYLPDRDMTAHAERLLATQASKTTGPEISRRLHALHLGRAVRDVRRRDVLGRHRPPRLRPVERRLKTITGNHAENPTLDLPCRTVFAAGQRHVEVVGPLLEDEAAAVHDGVWGPSG